MEKIIGKWVQKSGQPYEGLWFQFNSDGTFEAQYEPMGIVSSGTYMVEETGITLQQNAHTLGFVGEFKGLIKIIDDELKMALASAADQERPEDLQEARIYLKEQG